MTAPLLDVPHNWIDGVTRVVAAPCAVLATEDGTEQRLAHAAGTGTTLTYRVAAPSSAAMGRLLAQVTAAYAAADPDRARVRAVRWEDAVTLAAEATAGATTLTTGAAQDCTLRAFADGGAVALWIPEQPARTLTAVTLAASGAVAATTLTLAAGLADGWPAGTRVAPIADARLVEPVQVTRRTGTVAVAEIVVALASDVAGTVSPDAAAEAVTPVVASVAVQTWLGTAAAQLLYAGQQAHARLVARDAAGLVIPVPGTVTWVVTPEADAGRLTIVARGTGERAHLTAIDSGSGTATLTVTATESSSGLAAAFNVVHSNI